MDPMHFFVVFVSVAVFETAFGERGAKLAKNCQKIAHDLVRTKAAKAKAVIVFHGQVCRLLCQIVSQQLLPSSSAH